jgi:hypothetical protein
MLLHTYTAVPCENLISPLFVEIEIMMELGCILALLSPSLNEIHKFDTFPWFLDVHKPNISKKRSEFQAKT